MKQFLHNYKLKLTTISPVHIGDGDMYDPTNYVIDEGYLYYFDDAELVSVMHPSQQEALTRIVSQPDSYQQLQLFYKREDIRALAKKHALYKVPVSKDIEQNYNESLGRVRQTEGDGKAVFNALSINTTMKTSDIPYIPASSFKGALKTAFYSVEAKNRSFKEVAEEWTKVDRKENRKVFKDYKFKSDYFGQFESDPFSKIKISDFFPKNPQMQIKWGVNKKKKEDTFDNDNTGIRYEFIAPGSEFAAEMTLMALLDKQILDKINQNIGNNRKKLNQPYKQYIKEDIVKTANNFYLPKFEEEERWAKRKSDGLISHNYFQRTIPYIEKAKQNQGFLIRVGRHSGAICMTLDNHRHILIPQMKKDKDGNPLSQKEKYVASPFTYWLASDTDQVKGAEFIGWVYCEFVDDETYFDIATEYQILIEKQTQIRKQIENKLKEEENAQIEAEELEAKHIQEKQMAEEQKKRQEKEKLAAMSPAEAKIYELIQNYPNPNETSDVVIYNAIKNGKLDDVKCEALKILQQEMQNLKKWVETSKKPEKDKKYKRTQEVMQMLKECSQ